LHRALISASFFHHFYFYSPFIMQFAMFTAIHSFRDLQVASLGFPGYAFGLFMPWCGAWISSAASAGDRLPPQTSVLLPPFSPTIASAADLAQSSLSPSVHSLLSSSPPPVSMVAMPRTLDQIVRHERLVQFQEEVHASSSQGSSVSATRSVSIMFAQVYFIETPSLPL